MSYNSPNDEAGSSEAEQLRQRFRAERDCREARTKSAEAKERAAQAKADERKTKAEEKAANAKCRATPNPLGGDMKDPVTEDPLFKLRMDGLPVARRFRLFLDEVKDIAWADDPEDAIAHYFQRLKDAGLAPGTKIGSRKSRSTPLDELFKLLEEKGEIDLDNEAGFAGVSPVVKELAEEVFGKDCMSSEAPLRGETSTQLPQWQLPDGSRSYTVAGQELGRAMAKSMRFYVRGGTLFVLESSNCTDQPPKLEPITHTSLCSLIEGYVLPYAFDNSRAQDLMPTLLEPHLAKTILKSEGFKNAFPVVNRCVNCPLLVERDGDIQILQPGFDAVSGTFISGPGEVEAVPVNVAVADLRSLFDEFVFATPADCSRAMAMLITPALLFGGFLTGRVAVDLGEADESQSGKGYRQRITAEIYNEPITSITQRARGGVGSLDESFDNALVLGRQFIQIDNLRGKLNSQSIESFLTQPSYSARLPHLGFVALQPEKYLLFITSNGAELTEDMANRCCFVRIRKKEGEFREYPEGDLLSHVKANQPHYLGCVFAVLEAWIEKCKPRTKETRHPRREWCATLDWIIQNIFSLPPIMDGHEPAKQRAASPSLTFLRLMAIAVEKAGRLEEQLTAASLWNIACGYEVQVPGLSENSWDYEDRGYRAIGRIMAPAFQSGESITVDQFQVERVELLASEDTHHATKSYVFSTRNPRTL